MAVRTLPARNRSTMLVGKADLQFQIDQIRKDKMIFALEAIVVSFLMVLTAVFLPEVIFRVIYGSGNVQADLSALSWIPVVAYAVAAIFSLLTLLGNLSRYQKIKRLEQELARA